MESNHGKIQDGRKTAKMERWQKPEEGYVNINCDASFKPAELSGGYGVVVINLKGNLVEGVNGCCNASSVIAAEAGTLKHGMLLAKRRGYVKVIFEIDSKELMEVIRDDTRIPWEVYAVIKDIQAMMVSFPSWRYSVVRREVNEAADWVAKQSRTQKMPMNWVNQPPMTPTTPKTADQTAARSLH